MLNVIWKANSVVLVPVILGLMIAASRGEAPGVSPLPASSPATQPGTLRAAAEQRGLLVGAAVFPAALEDQRYAETLAREFNLITPENDMKWVSIHPEPARWNFTPADTLVRFAEKHGMKVKGHCLIWHEALPEWVKQDMPKERFRAIVRQHILKLVGRYRGRVWAWDVLNEVVDNKEGLRQSIFLERLGEDYIAEAFRTAHEADPKALLIYNDYGAEGLGGKSDRVYELVRKLKEQDVPVGGVGLQMHIAAHDAPKPQDMIANIRRLAALGLKVCISEMDVRVKDVPGDRIARLEMQRRVYQDVLAAFLSQKDVFAISFWGFTDAHSWVDHFFGPDDPLPFDEDYQPKPAYWGVLSALTGR